MNPPFSRQVSRGGNARAGNTTSPTPRPAGVTLPHGTAAGTIPVQVTAGAVGAMVPARASRGGSGDDVIAVHDGRSHETPAGGAWEQSARVAAGGGYVSDWCETCNRLHREDEVTPCRQCIPTSPR